jgi:hypothetical protein
MYKARTAQSVQPPGHRLEEEWISIDSWKGQGYFHSPQQNSSGAIFVRLKQSEHEWDHSSPSVPAVKNAWELHIHLHYPVSLQDMVLIKQCGEFIIEIYQLNLADWKVSQAWNHDDSGCIFILLDATILQTVCRLHAACDLDPLIYSSWVETDVTVKKRVLNRYNTLKHHIPAEMLITIYHTSPCHIA